MVLDPLTNPAPGDADGRALLQALGLLDRGLDWSAVEESTVAQRSDQLSTLDTVVGDATPEDLVGIGVLPGDAEDLQSQVEALDTDDRDPELIELDIGVVIQ
jgi:hypothetical protein